MKPEKAIPTDGYMNCTCTVLKVSTTVLTVLNLCLN